MTFHQGEPVNAPAPCYPEQRRSVCLTCSRRKDGRPLPPDMRQFVVIDASAYATEANCPMHAPWPVVRHFAEMEAA